MSNTSEGVPTIDKKQASTLLYVKDGETAVIGGIYEREEGSSENGIPGPEEYSAARLAFQETGNDGQKNGTPYFYHATDYKESL